MENNDTLPGESAAGGNWRRGWSGVGGGGYRQHAGPQVGVRQPDVPGGVTAHRMSAQKNAVRVNRETLHGVPQEADFPVA